MAITVVQSAHAVATTKAFTTSTTAGNCLVVIYASYVNTSVPNVTAVKIGGAADNFTSAVSKQVTGISGFEDMGIFMWYDYNCVGGQTSVAVSGSNLSSSSAGGIAIYEVAGLGTTAAILDQTNSGGNNSGASYDSGSITTTAPSEIVFGGVVFTSGDSAPAGWTNMTGTDVFTGYKILTSTGAADFSGSGTAPYAAVIASFKGIPAFTGGQVVQANQAVMRAAIW